MLIRKSPGGDWITLRTVTPTMGEVGIIRSVLMTSHDFHG